MKYLHFNNRLPYNNRRSNSVDKKGDGAVLLVLKPEKEVLGSEFILIWSNDIYQQYKKRSTVGRHLT